MNKQVLISKQAEKSINNYWLFILDFYYIFKLYQQQKCQHY